MFVINVLLHKPITDALLFWLAIAVGLSTDPGRSATCLVSRSWTWGGRRSAPRSGRPATPEGRRRGDRGGTHLHDTAQAVGSITVTSTLLGSLREDARSRREFFALTGVNA
jgi:hypothetical protein